LAGNYSLPVDRELLYIGSYTRESDGRGQGIYLALRDPGTGRLELQDVAAQLRSPTFLAWHPGLAVLYATSEPDRTVSAFRAGPSGSLEFLGSQPTAGELPCHVRVHPSGRYLFVANYAGGSFSVHRLTPGGGFGHRPHLVRQAGHGPDPDRQDRPHVHCTLVPPDGRHVLVADLGADTVTSYPFDAQSGTIDELSAHVASTAPGAGPRHLALGGDGRLYVSCELDSTVTVYALEDGGARLRWLESRPATGPGASCRGPDASCRGPDASCRGPDASCRGPVPANFPSEILLDAGLGTLYLGNRGADVISVFATGPGPLEPIADVPAGGLWPRHFARAGDHLYVGCQDSDVVTVLALGPSGVPQPAGEAVPVPSPACLLPEPRGGLELRAQRAAGPLG
jgi:6-phosphogluconolactonase